MNIKDYLEKREREKMALKEEERGHRQICPKCIRSIKACFCKKIQPFSTNFEFCLLMHPMEARKETVGTGRLSNLALEKCRIIIDENFDNNEELQNLLNDENYSCMLLYPGEKSINLSERKINVSLIENKTPLVLVLDGTWPCAKSMMRDSRCLHSLPRISFNADVESLFNIKHQPDKYCLSTIESLYQVLNALEDQGLERLNGKQEHLMEILNWLIEFQIECANDPNKQNYRRHERIFKSPKERKRSKKWNSRKICFEEDNYHHLKSD